MKMLRNGGAALNSKPVSVVAGKKTEGSRSNS